MNRELQAIVERLIEAERVAFNAKQAATEATATAKRLEVESLKAETERQNAKIAFNQAIISLSINPGPASANTPAPAPSPAKPRSEHFFCRYCERDDEKHNSEDHHDLTECDRCDCRDGVTKDSENDSWNAPEYCPACWEWAKQSNNREVCSECWAVLRDREKENTFANGRCDTCAGSPCQHCGIKGGH